MRRCCACQVRLDAEPSLPGDHVNARRIPPHSPSSRGLHGLRTSLRQIVMEPQTKLHAVSQTRCTSEHRGGRRRRESNDPWDGHDCLNAFTVNYYYCDNQWERASGPSAVGILTDKIDDVLYQTCYAIDPHSSHHSNILQCS